MTERHSIKFDGNVPVKMRDGAVLRADVYRPDTDEQYPAVLLRTPYNKAGPGLAVLHDPLRFAKNGYAFVLQDCRGTGASEGEFKPAVGEGSDGYDTVEWIAKQPWCNGKVGMCGNSYLGFVQWAAASQQPPYLTAISPGMVGRGRDLFYVGGAFNLALALPWGLLMGLLELARTPPPSQGAAALTGRILDAVDAWEEQARSLPLREQPLLKDTGLADFYFEWLSHPDDDEYWQHHDSVSYEKITVPSYILASWYDPFLNGTLASYRNMKESGGSEQASENVKLIIGPWVHGAQFSQHVGEIDFGLRSAGATIDLVGIDLRWFDHWLKGLDTGIADEPPVRIFVMGDNVWRNENEWPLARTEYIKYYMHSGGCANSLNGDGTLSTDPPGAEEYDIYLYDPRNPVLSKGGRNLESTGIGGAFDQREVEERHDVLVYSTRPLENDTEVTGPLEVKLYAASSASDTDFTAKLVDVWPSGKAYNLAEGIIRARYRKSNAKQSLINPGEIYEYTIDLAATSNVFKAGHRIRIEISSSDFPHFDRNPGTGHSFGQDAVLKPATQCIFHDNARASHIVLPVIPR